MQKKTVKLKTELFSEKKIEEVFIESLIPVLEGMKYSSRKVLNVQRVKEYQFKE